MKLPLIFVVFLVLCADAKAQDLVVTHKPDSIHCRITRITKHNIYFFYQKNGEIRDIFLPLRDVASYRKGFYSIAEVPETVPVKKPSLQNGKFHAAIHGGVGFLTSKVNESVPDYYKNYIKELRTGFQAGGQVAIFASEYLGFGIQYKLFRTSNITTHYNASLPPLQDDITVHYLGPAVFSRFTGSGKFYFITGLGIGAMLYKDKAVNGSAFTLTGSTVGLNWSMGAGYRIGKHFFAGLDVSYVTGSLKKFKREQGGITETITLEDKNRESLNRLNLSAAIYYDL